MITSDLDLCIPLYIAAKAFRNEHNRLLRKQGLTFTQFIVMIVLWEEKSLLVKEIGKKLELDSGTLSPVLKKLEEKGYVVRKQSKEDARDLVVTVTREGQELKTRVEDVHRKMFGYPPVDSEKSKRIRRLVGELTICLREIFDNETDS